MKAQVLLTACCFVLSPLAINAEDAGIFDDSAFSKNGIVTPDTATNTYVPVPNAANACSNQPCKNGAVCFYYSAGGFACKCPYGYVGRICNHKGCWKFPFPFFINPYFKDCSSGPYKMCALVDKKPTCVCFDDSVCGQK